MIGLNFLNPSAKPSLQQSLVTATCTVICRLEALFGINVDWKYENRLETEKAHWKNRNKIGNKKRSFETFI